MTTELTNTEPNFTKGNKDASMFILKHLFKLFIKEAISRILHVYLSVHQNPQSGDCIIVNIKKKRTSVAGGSVVLSQSQEKSISGDS